MSTEKTSYSLYDVNGLVEEDIANSETLAAAIEWLEEMGEPNQLLDFLEEGATLITEPLLIDAEQTQTALYEDDDKLPDNPDVLDVFFSLVDYLPECDTVGIIGEAGQEIAG